MTALQRIRVAWTGFPGAPGVSTFYSVDAAGVLGDLQTFFTYVAGNCPPVVTINVLSEGDVIESTTGDLTGSWSAASEPPLLGINAPDYAAPSGASVGWLTTTVIGGKRIRGRTFLVPLSATVFDSDGSLDSGFYSGLVTAASALQVASGGNLVIYRRPTGPLTSDGAFGPITGTRVRDRVATLRSRQQ